MGNAIVKTPYLDMLSNEAFILKNSFCVCPLCVPSRTSFFTGQYVHRTGSIDNSQSSHIKKEDWNFAEKLKSQGYSLGFTGKNHTFENNYLNDLFDYREEYTEWGKVLGDIRETDLAVKRFRYDEKREDFQSNREEMGLMEGLIEESEPFPEEQCTTYRIIEDAITFIKNTEKKPFMLYCSFPDPHFPNIVCEPYYSMYNPDNIPELPGAAINWDGHPFKHYVQSKSSGYENYTIKQRKRILATYYGQVTSIDSSIGKLLSYLDQSGLTNKTIILFTADHGDFGGQYGLVGKTGGFYEPLIRIPLLIRIPGMTPAKISAQISNIDIMPTIFDFLDFDMPQRVQGKSFLPVLQNKASQHRNTIFAEVGRPQLPPPAMDKETFRKYSKERRNKDGVFWFCDYTTNGRSAMIREDGWKYCYYVGDQEELYNLTNDPLELVNLAGKGIEIETKLKNKLMDWLLTEPFS